MSATAEIHPFFFDEDDKDDLNIQFDPKQFQAVTPYSEDLDDEYQQAQDQLRALRQQEEQIKRQAAELEELTKKEQQFKSGRIEVCEELNRYLSVLDREATEARRVAEDCTTAHERLESHLANINALRPEMWSRADRKAELARAISYIEAAEDEIDNVLPMINGFSKKPGLFKAKTAVRPASAMQSATQGDFTYWLKSGFAFSLPFVGFGVIALIGFLFF
jgi:DNA repair exonuclease SbcCD ATPase subunit